MSTHPMKIHPLVAVAAGTVIIVSLVGTAAILDWLPGSRGDDDKVPEAALIQPVDKTGEPAVNGAKTGKAPATASAHREAKAAASQGRHAPAPSPSGAPPQAAQPMPPIAQAAPVCAACGKVLGVRTVEVEVKPSGVGVVAGAVVGGLLGNQVGGGTGKTLATVAGAVGGGYAGNEIEKRTRKAAAYEVDVQLEDGARRSFRYEAAPAWKPGDRVRVVDGTLAAR